MLIETFEVGFTEGLLTGAVFAVRLDRALKRVGRHVLVYAIMRAFNFAAKRVYLQYRPDRYADRFEEIAALQTVWERGRRGNNRGDYARLYFLLANVEALDKAGIAGAFAELGVYKGNSAKVLHSLSPNRELFLFDTFAGFPDRHVSSDPRVVAARGYASALNDVRKFVGEDTNIIYCPGLFPDTASMVPADTQFALVHIDCDLYVPTKAALEFFYPRMVDGGLLIIHDHDSGCWPGVTLAADEFFANTPERLIRIPDKSGTAVMVKQYPFPAVERSRT